jgi:hypothetical protein
MIIGKTILKSKGRVFTFWGKFRLQYADAK